MLKLYNEVVVKKAIVEQLQHADVTLAGTVTAYHYTDIENSDVIMLDPVVAFQRKKSYTMNDYKLSSVPRLWFYTDLTSVERKVVSSSKVLYYTKIKGETILDINRAIQLYQKNPDKLKYSYSEAFWSVNNFMTREKDFQQLMQDAIDNGYKGIFYDNGNPMINYFYPIKAKKFNKGV